MVFPAAFRSLPLILLVVFCAAPALASAQGVPELMPATPVDPQLPAADGKIYVMYTFNVPEGTKSFRVSAVSKDDHPVRIFLRHGQPMPEWTDADHRGDTTVYVDGDSQPPIKPGTWHLDVAYAGEAPAGNTCRILLELNVDPPDPTVLAVDGELKVAAETKFALPHSSGRTYLTYTLKVTDDMTRVRIVVTSEQDIEMFVRHGSQMETYEQADHASRGAGPCEVTIVRNNAAPKPLRSGTYFIDLTFQQSAMQMKASGSINVMTNTANATLDGILQPKTRHAFQLPHGDNNRHYQTFVVDAPAGSKSIRFVVVGDDGIDLYIRHGAQMQSYREADYSVIGQSLRDIYIDQWHPDKPFAPGRYYVDVAINPGGPVKSARGQIMVLIDQDPPVDGRVMPGTPLPFSVNGKPGGGAKKFFIDVPAGVAKMVVSSECGNDIDLGVRFGLWTNNDGEVLAESDSGNEECVLVPADGEAHIKPGRYYVIVVFAWPTGKAEGKISVTLSR